MPHMAPLKWLLMPIVLTLIIYIQLMSFHYNYPLFFPQLQTSHFKFAPWTWS